MRWVRDQTGRFAWRPWYDKEEIDRLCEGRVERFLCRRYGVVQYPLSTDDLTLLVEQDVDDLDLYADLADETTATVEGVTSFVVGARPRVRIAQTLSLAPAREPRLRTTLAHELGHVLLHDFVGTQDEGREIPYIASDDPLSSVHCTTATTLGTRGVDWLEWQAGYASGALLMPRAAVQAALAPLTQTATVGPAPRGRMGRLLDRLQGQFLVSAAAAYVRLHQLGYLSYDPAPASE